MFNPQRRSKINDIYMQQKWYQMHVSKIRNITHSISPQKQRQKQQSQQQKYLKRLALSKKQVKQRVNNDVSKSNHRFFLKLLETDGRKQQNPEEEYIKNKKQHFNSYFRSKKQVQRVGAQNFTMITRMMNSSSQVPTLRECKEQHKKNKKLRRKCQKLPSIFQHQSQYKDKFSRLYQDESQFKSRVKSSRFSCLELKESRVRQKQSQVFSKELFKHDKAKGSKQLVGK